MDILLPPRINRQPAVQLTGARQVTIVGANGSGKSRFCSYLLAHHNGPVFRLGALRALFNTPDDDEPLPGSINALFNAINDASPQLTNTATTEFDKLSYLMMLDEFRELMEYKTERMLGHKPDFPQTRLDRVVHTWQALLPGNKMLRENGRLLFSTEGHDDKYSSLRLSDGEKSVLYYVAGVLYAPQDALVLVDDPEMSIHHSLMRPLWNAVEELRPDCTIVYNTHDVEFAASRVDNQCVWVKSYDPQQVVWDYEVMPSSENLSDALYLELLGSRKPVLFVEGDESHSIDARLYPLIFPEYTVKPLGSCNKVIETVRSFADLQSFHRLECRGIVDRDRRSDQEVEYLNRRNIYVPNVAEVENILMLEPVVRAVATHCHCNADNVFAKVRRSVLDFFSSQLREQALQHVRHRVKRDVEKRIDMKFGNIADLENHMVDLVREINPRASYEQLCRDFHRYVKSGDYMKVLKVFNQKQMVGHSNVASLCGLTRRNDYLLTILNMLKSNAPGAERIRQAIKECFGLG